MDVLGNCRGAVEALPKDGVNESNQACTGAAEAGSAGRQSSGHTDSHPRIKLIQRYLHDKWIRSNRIRLLNVSSEIILHDRLITTFTQRGTHLGNLVGYRWRNSITAFGALSQRTACMPPAQPLT